MRLVTAELKAKTHMVHCRTEIAGARLDLSPGAEDYAVKARPPFHAQHTPDIVATSSSRCRS
jgi:hypothetical protein